MKRDRLTDYELLKRRYKYRGTAPPPRTAMGPEGGGGGGGIQKILKVIYIFQVMRLCLNRCVDLE